MGKIKLTLMGVNPLRRFRAFWHISPPDGAESKKFVWGLVITFVDLQFCGMSF